MICGLPLASSMPGRAVFGGAGNMAASSHSENEKSQRHREHTVYHKPRAALELSVFAMASRKKSGMLAVRFLGCILVGFGTFRKGRHARVSNNGYMYILIHFFQRLTKFAATDKTLKSHRWCSKHRADTRRSSEFAVSRRGETNMDMPDKRHSKSACWVSQTCTWHD